MQIGPNGPVPLDPGTYDYDDLRERLRIALAGPEEGRAARVRGALRAARFFASQIPVLRVLSLSTTTLKEGEAAAISIYDVIDGVALTGAVPAGMELNSVARTIVGTPREPGQFSMRIVQTLAGAVGSPGEQTFDLTIISKDGTAPVIPDPVVIEPTDIGSDGTPQVDELLTGIDPIFRYATIVRRRWLFGVTVLTPNATYTPRVEGRYKFVVDGIGENGKPIASEAEVVVTSATVTPPDPGDGQSIRFNSTSVRFNSTTIRFNSGATGTPAIRAVLGQPAPAAEGNPGTVIRAVLGQPAPAPEGSATTIRAVLGQPAPAVEGNPVAIRASLGQPAPAAEGN